MAKNLSVSDVTDSVIAIKEEAESSRDYEHLHGLEDSLFEEVLMAIAKGQCDDPAGCAGEALKCKKIKFARHCA